MYQDFAHAYLTEVGAAAGRMLTRGQDAVDLLHRAAVGGGRIRAFGNGGSSAIVRSALLQLQAHTGRPVSDSMMSPAAMAYTAQRGIYSEVFARSLAADIRSLDLVVVASVSGRSANIREALSSCREHDVPVLALVGGDGAQVEPTRGMVWATGTADQQISEDAMLTALTLAAATALGPATAPLATRVDKHLHAVAAVDTVRLGAFLAEATEAVTAAIRTRRPIYVLCPDGGPLALAGEHFAHNLHWDAPLGVEGVQPPVVVSDPSLADMSAIYNDHPNPAHGVVYQLRSAAPGDVVFLLTYDAASRTTQEAIHAAEQAGARLLLLHRSGPTQPHTERLQLPQADDFALSALVQSVAHLVCRTSRAALSAGGTRSSVADLMAQDLAPLRELSDTRPS
ncbi:SIS domain-containing protein [Streptomyces sp. NPDC097617]|uniref:SIS domain-containing protein n=1 Tax=Streptomyces sp. NPDC097617 TaxID=3366091 RepID=UPI003817D3AE